MITPPDIALSVRQPWAWAILHAGKDVENRDWRLNAAHLARARSIIRSGGRILIHASQGMPRHEYEEAIDAIRMVGPRGLAPPVFDDLPRGGIVGVVTITGAVADYASPWFSGPVGLLLRDARSLPYVACKGMLGFWKVPGDVMARLRVSEAA